MSHRGRCIRLFLQKIRSEKREGGCVSLCCVYPFSFEIVGSKQGKLTLFKTFQSLFWPYTATSMVGTDKISMSSSLRISKYCLCLCMQWVYVSLRQTCGRSCLAVLRRDNFLKEIWLPRWVMWHLYEYFYHFHYATSTIAKIISLRTKET